MTNKNPGYKKILIFWLPLAATWLMMAIEGPLLAAIIARLPNPKFNLAAYGVAFSLALIVEAPIIMLLSSSVALARDKDSYLKLRKFAIILNCIITVVMIILILPPVFKFISQDLMNLPDKVAELAHISTTIMIPWPAAIGFRRFYQGLLIRNDLTRRVTYGTVFRICTIILTSFILYKYTELHGAYIGALSLSLAVTFEALGTRAMANRSVEKILSDDNPINFTENRDQNLTMKSIRKFYFPLAASSMLALGVRPIVTFFMGHSRFPIESLAVLPVIDALIFIFRSFGLAYLEVGVALTGDNYQNYEKIRNFAYMVAMILTAAISVVAFTDLSKIWFHDISGLSWELTSFAILPLKLGVFLPALMILISVFRSIHILAKKSAPITKATTIEVVIIVAILTLNIKYFNLAGVLGAVIALALGRLAANIYLLFPMKKILKKDFTKLLIK